MSLVNQKVYDSEHVHQTASSKPWNYKHGNSTTVIQYFSLL